MNQIFKYKLVVEVDNELLEKKYPNFKINYNSSEEFADAIVRSIGADIELKRYNIKIDLKKLL